MKNLFILFGMIALIGCKTTQSTTETTKTVIDHKFKHTSETVTLPTSNTIVLQGKIPPTRKTIGNSTIVIEPTIGGLSTLTIETPEYVSRIDTVYVEKNTTVITDIFKKVTVKRWPWWIWALIVAVVAIVALRIVRGIWIPRLPKM
jgi:hypothetical protein